MEFHVSRAVRNQAGVDESLFNYAGNVVFGNLAASREFVKKYNEAREPGGEPGTELQPAALFAMGLIDELNHALIARYRQTVDPDVLSMALKWLEASENAEQVDLLLRTFTTEFPNVAVYRGEQTVEAWLAASTPAELAGTQTDQPNREIAVEELLMVWLANLNPAFAPFKDLFDDKGLEQKTVYRKFAAELPEFFATRPAASSLGSLLDVLKAPMLASPDSLSGQLAYIRDYWTEQLGPEFGETLRRTLLAVDVLKEEEVAVWMIFHPPSGGRHQHGEPQWGSLGFVGDEFVGFEEDYVVGADGVRRRREQPPTLNEYEAFSPDQAWMPTVVMIAKSTYVWLEQLSKKYQRHIQRLDQIPGEELALLAERGINALWLIGLWERSTASQTIKRMMGQHDAVASAYSLKDYRIADDLGGTWAYERLRDTARRHGIRLASDMVPNHMGIDSTWVMEHPEWFLSRNDSPFPVYSFEGPDLSTESRFEIKIEDHYFSQTDASVVFRLRERSNGYTQFVYHGNDGTTFAWNDTAQLDYSKAFVREQVMQTILEVARLFPIIRFDAAMTLAKKHVQRLWFPLPGVGGSIPSRAEAAISQAEFDAMMPNEFWREVVDRVAMEVPGTLLLAEAFWLLEGYFVRTLGMHRVYNSAFMNMLRDEENAKYRSYLKKTIEFDPDILKRYVNFMSNPDEKTAIEQFGTGDKYFGTCTMLATIPGLPMLGHGQIEAFTEKYGMEYKTARFDEAPNQDLIARHMREIAPLLKNRQLFADSHNFVMYDFWAGEGDVNENVFAYSNRVDHGGSGYGGSGAERALMLYNNAIHSARGTIHVSCASMDKGSGELRQRTLREGLRLPSDPDIFLGYRDSATKLEYLRGSQDFDHGGFTIELRGYQYAVLEDWRELRATAEAPWNELAGALHGGGVYHLDEALKKLRLRPLYEALERALAPDVLRVFIEASTAAAAAHQALSAEEKASPTSALAVETTDPELELPQATEEELVAGPAPVAHVAQPPRPTEPANSAEAAKPVATAELAEPTLPLAREEKAELALPLAAEEPAEAALPSAIAIFVERAACVLEQERLVGPSAVGAEASSLIGKANAAIALSATLKTHLDADLLQTAGKVLPGVSGQASGGQDLVWAPLLATILIENLATDTESAVELFDHLQLRAALADLFRKLGLDGESSWRAAARVRLLQAHPAIDSPEALADQRLWSDADVGWLASLSESAGVTYLNKECFEELLWWLQLPRLLRADRPQDFAAIGEFVSSSCQALAGAGYDLAGLRQALVPAAAVPVEAIALEAASEPVAEDRLKAGKADENADEADEALTVRH